MTFKAVPIGDIITPVSERNTDLRIKTTLGVNLHKRFIPSIANLDTVDLSNYKIVKRGQFGCKLMSVGRDGRLPISLLSEYDEAVISPAYHVFEVDKNVCIPEYLMVLFLKHEFERELWFKGDADVRAGVSWEYFCETKIPLPPIEKQREYVAIYSNLLKLSSNHEKSFDNLRFIIDTLTEKLAEQYGNKLLGNYIKKVDIRNKDGSVTIPKSVSVTKEFKSTGKKVNKNELHKYKIVEPGQFAYVPTTGNERRLCIALSLFDYNIVVTQVDIVFKLTTNQLMPEFVYIYLSRKEMDRYARYHSWGSVRETFDWSEMARVRIPVPPLAVQKSIVAIYHALESRKALNERLKNTVKDISPVLIKDAKDRCMEVAA